MIQINFKMPSTAELKKAAMAELEKQVSVKARHAAARHGGVSVRFSRKPDGTIRAVEFQGSDAAIQAAKDAVADGSS
jgi:hypothetical protein